MRARSHRFDARAVALLIVKKKVQNATKHNPNVRQQSSVGAPALPVREGEGSRAHPHSLADTRQGLTNL